VSDLAPLLPLVLIVLVFWLLIVRPQRKRQQQYATLQNELVPGLEVMTTSGIYAEVVTVGDQEVTLRIADGVQIRVHRQAIGQVVRPETAEPETTEGD